MSEARGHTATPRGLLVASVILLLALLSAFGWVASRVVASAIELTGVNTTMRGMADSASAGDSASLLAGTRDLVAHADAAAAAASDPLWPLAEALPWWGDDAAALRTLAVHASSIGDTILPLIDLDLAHTDLTTQSPALHAMLTRTARALSDADSAVSAVETSGLHAKLSDAIAEVRQQLSAITPTVRTLVAATAVLPDLLGADGARSVLFMLQNSAEARTGGGITGSFALVSAEAGTVSLVTQADSASFDGLAAPNVPIPASTNALYGDIAGRFVQNASLTSDFTLTARLASAWWVALGHTAPDAIVSIDPLAIRALLTVIGPLTLPDGSSLTADNIFQRVLLDPYLTLASEAQTLFLQSVTSSVIEALPAVHADPLVWARALAQPLTGGSISVWSANSDVQAKIDGSPLAGPAARHAAAGDAGFAVYVNDATGGKLDSFLHLEIGSETSMCRTDGRSDTLIRVTMRSSVPVDADFPGDMTGDGRYSVAIGDIGTSISVAAPPGTFFGGVQKDGVPEVSVDVDEGGFPTSLVRVNLSPDEVNVVDFRFVSAQSGAPLPQILTTPLLNTAEIVPPTVLSCG